MPHRASSSRTNGRLLSRLYQDLVELQANPYPGVAVFTDDADFRRICLVLTPPSGPWTGLSLHFDVMLPDNWPMAPPMVSSSTGGINHPNLFGSYICCDLLKPTLPSQGGYTGGYSPALTLRGLFLQFLTFFSSTKIEQDSGYDVEIGDHMLVCYVLDSEVDQHWPPSEESYRFRTRNQQILKTLWESDITDEVVVRRQGKATQYVKTFPNTAQSVHKIEFANFRWTSAYESISTWTCRKCPYGGPDLPHHQVVLTTPDTTIYVPASLLRSPLTCCMANLNDDVLGEIASFLPSESMISFSMAYQRFRHVVTYMHLLLRLELRCFFLRTPLNECILGIGIRFNPGARALSSDFDWLSMEAFDDFKVRCSIQKRSFDFFLPLAFNRSHFVKAQPVIWARLAVIEGALRQEDIKVAQKIRQPMNRRAGPPVHHHQKVEVLYRMMNNIVVSLMKSCDDAMGQKAGDHTRTLLYASEKAVISYCHLFHLLIRLCESTPAILRGATQKLQQFIDQPETRLKKHTPDMGELIVLITLVLVLPPVSKPPITWNVLCGKFLQEAITRNVRWVLKALPELEVMETGASDFRLNNTFNNSRTSLRLIMFQISFLRLFIRTYSSNMSCLHDNYGFADKELPEQMVAEIKAIYAVDNWPNFFRCIKFSKGLTLSKSVFSDMLREAVQQSAVRKYHVPLNKRNLEEVQKKRAKLESFGHSG